MTKTTFLFLAVSAFALGLSWLLTGAVRRYALSTHLLDVPNERSSHTRATPRGGGVAFVLVFMALCVAGGWSRMLDGNLAYAIVGAGALVGLLGFIDDRVGLTARVRFAGHAAAAAWVLWWMNPLPAVPIFGHPVDLGWAGLALCALFLVWMINLFNFMDGIDGIASIESIAVALSGALLWSLTGRGAWPLALLFAACVAGFLIWNFPPAKIFMGDAGSGFLGLVLGVLSLWCGQDQPELFWSWLILLGCFMVDATTTLVRRVRRGERFSEAHRTHAYQYAARRAGRHLPVSLAYGAASLLWLLPIAALAAFGRIDGLLGLIIAYAPLLALAFYFKAGDRAGQGD